MIQADELIQADMYVTNAPAAGMATTAGCADLLMQ
jgi:hypothetical protein